jgi:ApaG protein
MADGEHLFDESFLPQEREGSAVASAKPARARSSAPSEHGSDSSAEGISICVQPTYLPSHSDPSRGRYIFAYHVTIANDGPERVKLRSRAWKIVDADGTGHDVRGEGVVGRQPDVAPQERFEYSSFCPLPTPWGTMEGAYTFERADGSRFEVPVRRFYLVGPRERE